MNDKRFYFPNAVISLPFEHECLQEIDKFKKNKGQRIEWYFLKEKEKLLELEKKSIKTVSEIRFFKRYFASKC